MASAESLREHLLELLGGGHAHLDFEKAIAGLPVELRGAKPPRLAAYSLAITRAHADRPVGHPPLQYRPEAHLARIPRWLLARGRRPT